MPVDDRWIRDWIAKFDRGSRYDAITDLRLNKEKEVVSLNRELGERLKEFSKSVMEVYAFIESESPPDDLENRVEHAKQLEAELRELEQNLDRTRKEFEAFEHMEQMVNRMQ